MSGGATADLAKTIDAAFARRDEIGPSTKGAEREAVEAALDLLDRGAARVAEKQPDRTWKVNQWLKKAVLLSFRLNDMSVIAGGPGKAVWWDKVASKFDGWGDNRFRDAGFRAVPGCVVRRSAFIAPGVVLMPSFVNLGAYVDSGTMVDMRGFAAGELPFLAQHNAGAFGHDKHGRHAECMRNFEIAREVFENCGALRINVVTGQETFIYEWARLRLKLRRHNVENIIEMLVDAETAHHVLGVMPRAVGQDEFAATQFGDGGAERRVGLKRRAIDLVHDVEELVGLEIMFLHQAAQRRTVATVVIFLQPKCLVMRDFEKTDDVIADAPVDLLPEVKVMRIKRVVEIEHPGVDITKIAWDALRGSGTRSCHDLQQWIWGVTNRFGSVEVEYNRCAGRSVSLSPICLHCSPERLPASLSPASP